MIVFYAFRSGTNYRQPGQGKPYPQEAVACIAVVGNRQIRLHPRDPGRDFDGDGIDGGALFDAELARYGADEIFAVVGSVGSVKEGSAEDKAGEERQDGFHGELLTSGELVGAEGNVIVGIYP